MLGRIGPMELIIILAVVMIIFGVGRLPEVGGALGRSIREFRKSVRDESQEPETEAPAEPPRGITQPTGGQLPSVGIDQATAPSVPPPAASSDRQSSGPA